MFNKLLANLPFNPSLVAQVAFYGQRMRQEASIRRFGFLFVALAFLVQLFAVLSPPQASLAASNNDLVNGGFSTPAEAASDCSSNVAGFGTILANYGITCAKVASASTMTITSTDFNRQLFSMGRLPYNLAGETPVAINGVGTVYARHLWAWDKGAASTYKALNVTTAGGQTFFILYSCGNLTSIGMPQPVQTPPVLTLKKTTSPGGPVANSTVTPGTILFYRLVLSNAGGTAKNVVISDSQPPNTTFDWIGAGGASVGDFNHTTSTATWNFDSVPASATNFFVDIKFKVNADTPNGTSICNFATASADSVATITSNQVCMTVKVNAPKPTVTPTTAAVCPFDSNILQSNPQCVACPFNSNIIQSDAQCKPCSASLSSEDSTACVVFSKTASNLTQNISDANNTTAQAGNVISYTLSAKNTGQASVKNFVIQENISDVLDYANVQDLNGGALDNTLDELSWPGMDIAPGQTISKTFTVKVKNPIPNTPQSTTDPMHFDHMMTNVYGNTVNIKLPQTLGSTVQTAQSTLPNTGPGESLFVAVIVVIITGYFWSRSRVLAKEAVIVRNGDVV